jgi:hypothetical protein
MKYILSRIENAFTFGMEDADGATVPEGPVFTAERMYAVQLPYLRG